MPTVELRGAVVTHAVDLLAAAGVKVIALPIKRIDRDEYEVTIAALADRDERREGNGVIVTGYHEDHDRTTLRGNADVVPIRAEG